MNEQSDNNDENQSKDNLLLLNKNDKSLTKDINTEINTKTGLKNNIQEIK